MPKMSKLNSLSKYGCWCEMSIADLKLIILNLTNTPGPLRDQCSVSLYPQLCMFRLFMSHIHILTQGRHGSDRASVYCVVFIF